MHSTKDLFSPSSIKAILRSRSLSLTHRFGQNFLLNRELARRILEHADLKRDDAVMEIGPGLGTLTFDIASRVRELVAVEIDGGFVRYLQEECRVRGAQNVHVLNGDFLRLDAKLVEQFATPGTAVSNFPFAIGLKSVMKILEEYQSVVLIVGTVQQEIAERIVSHPGEKNYSWVSVYLQLLARTRVLQAHISPRNFFPPPEVKSAIIRVERGTQELPVEKKLFREFVKAAFSSRRKSLVNNLLVAYTELGRQELEYALRKRKKDARIRAEKLSVGDFVDLALEFLPLLDEKEKYFPYSGDD
jgi:16S rRNA (adenine1518-N6/adenine1519-N6)-dimethyltransferase